MNALKKSIQEAIRREKEAYDLYRLVSAATTDASQRELVERLAGEAASHLRIIERACRIHSPSLATFIHHFVPEIEYATDDGFAGTPGEAALREALRSAIEHKRELHDLYNTLSDAPHEAHWGEMFRALAEAEKAHLKFVQENLPAMS